MDPDSETHKPMFVRPFHLTPNPRSRIIIQDFLDSGLEEAEVDTSWSPNPRRVYEKLHKYLVVNTHLGISVILRDKKVVLVRKAIEVDI